MHFSVHIFFNKVERKPIPLGSKRCCSVFKPKKCQIYLLLPTNINLTTDSILISYLYLRNYPIKPLKLVLTISHLSPHPRAKLITCLRCMYNIPKEGNSGQQFNLCKISCQEPLLSHFRKPLNRKTRPLKSMGHNQVIQKRCILLPDFIFFIDDTLLHSIFKHWNLEKLSG